MTAPSEAAAGLNANEAGFDLDATFRAQYARVARIIARIVRDPARAEELAVDVFLKLSRTPSAQGESTEGWLCRAAVRVALDELRRQSRRRRYERLVGFIRGASSPEEIRTTREEQERVRIVLSVMKPAQAELLLLRSHGFSYAELASALALNPASVGTLLSRAQQVFRKEYTKRYGEE